MDWEPRVVFLPQPSEFLTVPVQTNAVFARIPDAAIQAMHARGWKFYTGVVTPQESRLMCSWDTTEGDVDAFVSDLTELMEKRDA